MPWSPPGPLRRTSLRSPRLAAEHSCPPGRTPGPQGCLISNSVDLEHTFRFGNQTLGWTRPKLRTPEAADRWTWLIIAAHTQLRLTREAAADLRRPWEKPTEPARLTPARVRRGFRNLRPHLQRLSHGSCPVKVKSDSLFGSEDQGGVGILAGGAELLVVRQ
jgi:hypothetical protein